MKEMKKAIGDMTQKVAQQEEQKSPSEQTLASESPLDKEMANYQCSQATKTKINDHLKSLDLTNINKMDNPQACQLVQQANPQCRRGHADWSMWDDQYCEVQRADAMCGNYDYNCVKGNAMVCRQCADSYCFACAWWGQ